jgi:hypothetical protein
MKAKNDPSKKTDPIDKKEEVQNSRDEHIDQDFENYPHAPAKENIIRPETEEDLKTASSGGVEEFSQPKAEEENNADEKKIVHTGSGGAFEATEEVDHDEDEEALEKKQRRNKIH